ncbi:MAG: hypothetical protein KDC44_18595, partial [Phaeodactylibacter sp.]|nr:hypothetical protein [Phaeodactylibacter sp.]
MTTKTLLECEAERLQKIQLLPNRYKRIGLVILIAGFAGLFTFAYLGENFDWYKVISKNVILLGMLLVSVAREKDEDEYSQSLRARSYMWAFVIGVLYALVQPYINFGVGELIRPEATLFEEMGAFQVVWFMLAIQLG